MKRDLYIEITDSIIRAMENGTSPWEKPWNDSGVSSLPLRYNGQAYQGINTVVLWMKAGAMGFASPYWMTYKQANELGGQVKRGSKGTTVVYASTFVAREENASGVEVERIVPFLKSYTVFNADQIDGLPDRYTLKPALPNNVERDAQAEAFFKGTGAEIRHGGDKAFFSPTQDFIQMPHLESFKDQAGYYATLAHEMTHWTGHESRLAREFGKRFGDEAYAFEELVAELGAAYLCGSLGLVKEPREDHASYISAWLEVLKRDKRAIFTAASHAQKACDYLYSLQKEEVMAA